MKTSRNQKGSLSLTATSQSVSMTSARMSKTRARSWRTYSSGDSASRTRRSSKFKALQEKCTQLHRILKAPKCSKSSLQFHLADYPSH